MPTNIPTAPDCWNSSSQSKKIYDPDFASICWRKSVEAAWSRRLRLVDRQGPFIPSFATFTNIHHDKSIVYCRILRLQLILGSPSLTVCEHELSHLLSKCMPAESLYQASKSLGWEWYTSFRALEGKERVAKSQRQLTVWYPLIWEL